MPTFDLKPAYLTLERAVAIAYALGRVPTDERTDIDHALAIDFDSLMRRLTFTDDTAYGEAGIGMHFTDAERTLIREHVDTFLPDGPLKTNIFDAIPDPAT